MTSVSAAGGVLAEARRRIGPALRAAVASLPEAMARVCSYHFGWDGSAGGPPPDAGDGWGKGVRCALTLACARAVGAAPAAAVPAAVAVELVHNASLVQDDVIDQDPCRRHRPSVWTVYGMPTAMLAGDALFIRAIRILHDGTPAARALLLETIEQLIAGEYGDHRGETRDVTVPEALAVVGAKTGALLRCACALGAGCGGNDRQIAHLGQFGAHLGVAFQLTDDLLDIWGRQVSVGKPIGSDLRRRKKTLPVVTALASGTAAGRELADLYRLPAWDDATLDRVTTLIDDTGARRTVRALAERHLGRARDHLAAARPSEPAGADLAALLDLAGRRDH